MAADPKHLRYPMRRYGMDHERYEWSMLEQRPAMQWPQQRAVALWINVCVQHFPLNPGCVIKAPGSMSMPYPDLRHYTLRDYGNRIGVYRVLDALAAHGLQASLAINAELAERYPPLLRDLAASGHEWLAHGWNMDCVHHGGMDDAHEQALIQRSLAVLSPHSPNALRGWLSPARSNSVQTSHHLRSAGIEWCGDWVNDELPYAHNTPAGALINLPLSLELDDHFIIGHNLHAESEYAEQIIDACEFLCEESRHTGHGRVLSLNVHAWMMGHAHRIKYLERVFAHLAKCGDALWNVSPSAIVDHAQRVAATQEPAA